MADEIKVDNVEPVQEPTPQPQLSPTEQRASEQGWVPKDQWDGDPDEWRPAKEFLDRGELFKKIEEQSKELKRTRQTVEDLKRHNARIAKVEYQKALEALKAEKKQAILEGDADAQIEIEEKMAEVRAAASQVQEAPAEPAGDTHPAFVAWKEKNNWYDSNRAMRAFADQIGIEIGTRERLSPSELLARVEAEVKKEFADKFTNPRRAAASAVEGSTPKAGAKKDTFELSADERRAMHRFVSQGVMDEKTYIQQLKEAHQRGV